MAARHYRELIVWQKSCLSEQEITEVWGLLQEVGKMLHVLMKSLRHP
ncbi:MAG: hypothetical protein IJR85_10055 [Synergistaceae bacterium]|nr:hypothetical protein [Synergistaceae bacterium]